MIKKTIKESSFFELILISGPPIFVGTLISIRFFQYINIEVSIIQKLLGGYSAIACLILFIWMFLNLTKNQQLSNKTSWILSFVFFTWGAALYYFFVIYKQPNKESKVTG